MLGGAAEQSFGGLREQSFSGAVHQPDAPVVVEREHGDVDLGHHRAQERRRFKRTEALGAERLAEQIRFEKCQPERIVAVSAARANRVVALAQGREHVGQRLQWTHDALAQDHRRDQPGADEDETERPLDLAAVAVAPQEHHGHDDTRQPGENAEAKDEALVM